MDNDLIEILKAVGLNQKESSVYLALLELSQGTAAKIAKLANLRRPTTYLILDDLIKKGFVTQIPNKKVNQYQAINPAVVMGLQKTALKNFSEMLPLLQTLHNKGAERPKINYIETEKGILNIYEEMNNAKESFFITSHSKIEKHFPGAVSQWVEKNKKGIYKFTGKNLIPENKEDIKLAKTFKDANKNVKYLPGIKQLDMDFVVYENNLAITSLGDNPFMVIMESEKLTASMKSIFELLWKMGKKIDS